MKRYAYLLGVYFRGFVLGVLLFVAFCELVATASGVKLFRYQGF